MTDEWAASREAFTQAADWFVRTTAEVGSTAAYYRATSALASGSAVAERGRQAGAALGVAADVPALPAAQALALAGELAAQAGHAATLLRALTGRQGLPPGFSVL